MTETGDVGTASKRGGGPWWWARRRGMALDVGLAAASAVECAFEGVRFADRADVPAVPAVLLGILVGAVLVLRRRWPIAVVLVAVAVTPAEMGILLGTVGLYTLAASEVPRRIIVLLAGMMVGGNLIITFLRVHESVGRDPTFDPPEWFIPLVSFAASIGFAVPPLLLGLYVGARRRLVVSLRERADGLERELSLLADRAEERAEWARNEERTRIAREMHDVVAHRVSLMVVHAAALQAVALKEPEKAAKNAALVGDMGRQALTELRTMLGVLRTGEGSGAATATEEDGAGAAAGTGTARLARFTGGAETVPPARSTTTDGGPTLDGLDGLLGESRLAGMTVELSVHGERPGTGYAARVERTAYRVVQEALTNVHKHAAGARTRVRLAHREGEVALQVENEPPARGTADAGLPSGGNGLVGMRERVTALGGVFVSGPTDAGGFRVSAVIPQNGA
ncbi:sensor histidine kinase [Streptomyces sp. TR02-1]|uniref:sensor histidine kinase n=1 Tax=Streptomyces sp. TR02-1 TaxID=3385977 RepID=UPI0039A3A435